MTSSVCSPVPGIGKISAFTIYLELDGIDRFPSDKDFVSYCRLVPGANNSNRSIRHRSHNKDGNRYLKIAFCDIAVDAVQYYPEIRAFYQRKARRSNDAIARTIVAKELARIVFHILKNKTDYRGFKGQPPSRMKEFQWPRLVNPNAQLMPEHRRLDWETRRCARVISPDLQERIAAYACMLRTVNP